MPDITERIAEILARHCFRGGDTDEDIPYWKDCTCPHMENPSWSEHAAEVLVSELKLHELITYGHVDDSGFMHMGAGGEQWVQYISGWFSA